MSLQIGSQRCGAFDVSVSYMSNSVTPTAFSTSIHFLDLFARDASP